VDGKMKILIGYDGSTYANAALKDLLRAGLPGEAEVVVISIPKSYIRSYLHAPEAENGGAGRNGKTDSPSGMAQEVEEAAAMAKQACDAIRESLPGWEVRADLAVGSTARVIAKKTSQWNPNLIVLGLQGDTEPEYFGGVLRRIAVGAKCSVRVAPRFNAGTDEAPRVLLCVDGTTYTEAAVSAVASRDWPKGTEVRLLTVVNPFDYSITEFADKAIERAKSLHRLIDNELDRTLAFTSSVVEEGEPEKVILRAIEEWRPDSVFLAPHNRNRFRRALLGGVSGAVVAQAKCAVELARMAAPGQPRSSFLRAPTTSPAFNR
jgi:nucleotide-binding universal stress UspA family protein